MRLAALCIAALLVLPLSVAGETYTEYLNRVCVGYTNPTHEIRKFDLSNFSAEDMKTYLNRRVMCPNACWDVTITIEGGTESGSPYLSVESNYGTSKCLDPKPSGPSIRHVFSRLPSPNEPRNCADGKGPPSVTITSSAIAGFTSRARTEGPKTRCDPTVAESFDSIAARKGDDGLAKVSSLSKPTVPTLGEVPLNAAYNELAREALGGTEEQRADVARSLGARDLESPEAVRKYLECFANGCDTETLKERAKDVGMTLNSDLERIVKLAGNSPPGDELRTEMDTFYDRLRGTFERNDSQHTPAQCGIEGWAGHIFHAESRCGRINYNTLSSVRGPGHFLCSTWNNYAREVAPQYVDDPSCSRGYRENAQIVAHVVNAKYNDFVDRYGDQCTSVGLTVRSCVYAVHVFGEGGFRNMYNAYVANPGMSVAHICGGALSNAACNNNRSIFRAGNIAGVFEELDRRIGGGGNIISHMATGGSPFASFTGSTGGILSYGGSPFARVNPLGMAMPTGLTGYSTPTSFSAPVAGTVPTAGTVGTGVTPRPPSTTVTPPPPTEPEAHVSIDAEPLVTQKGQPVTVTWSSENVRAEPECAVLIVTGGATSTLARGASGTKTINAPRSDETLRFSVHCIAVGGSLVEDRVSVRVQ